MYAPSIVQNIIPNPYHYSKQELITSITTLPPAAPSISKLLRLTLSPSVTQYTLLNPNNEMYGTRSLRILVEVHIIQRLSYIQLTTSSPYTLTIPYIKNIYLVLPDKINNQDTRKALLAGKLNITASIASSHSTLLDHRNILKEGLLLINVSTQTTY